MLQQVTVTAVCYNHSFLVELSISCSNYLSFSLCETGVHVKIIKHTTRVSMCAMDMSSLYSSIMCDKKIDENAIKKMLKISKRIFWK